MKAQNGDPPFKTQVPTTFARPRIAVRPPQYDFSSCRLRFCRDRPGASLSRRPSHLGARQKPYRGEGGSLTGRDYRRTKVECQTIDPQDDNRGQSVPIRSRANAMLPAIYSRRDRNGIGVPFGVPMCNGLSKLQLVAKVHFTKQVAERRSRLREHRSRSAAEPSSLGKRIASACRDETFLNQARQGDTKSEN